MRRFSLFLPLCLYLKAGDTGLPPRVSPADHPVHQSTPDSTVAAVHVKSQQVAKAFSIGIAKNYVVVEVAVYPKDGATVDVYPDTPEEAAIPWPEHEPINNDVQVTSETGIIVATQKDPVNGRRTSVGTYESTGIAAGNSGSPNPSHSSPDPRVTEDMLRASALPQGETSKAVAGYLYFPRPQKHPKDNHVTLVYSKEGASIYLLLEAKN